MSGIVLREGLRPADRADLERILRDCGVFREDEIAIALELVDDALARGAKSDYRFLLGEAGGATAGYCCYGLIGCTVHSYDIYWVVVDPATRRLGLGRRLLEAAEERIRAAGGRRAYVETSTGPHYEPARRFYLSCGYRVEAVQEDFYAPGDGKVTLVKVL